MQELDWFAKGYLIFLTVILFVFVSGFVSASFEQHLREKKQREAEKSCYVMAEKPYTEVTGENLELAARKISQAEARREGKIVISKQDYLSEDNIKRTQEKIKHKEQFQALEPFWNMLSDNEKEGYSNDINKYTEAKRQNLEDIAGLPLSKDAFSEMVKRGLNPEGIKKTGWFFKKIKISFSDGRPFVKMSKMEFGNWAKQLEIKVEESTKDAAKEELNRTVRKGEKRATDRRERHMREIMQLAAEKKEPQIEMAQNGMENRLQQLSNLRKIKRILPKLLEKIVSKRRGFDFITKKPKEKEPLSPEEVGYIQELGKMVGKEEQEIANIDSRKLIRICNALEKELEFLMRERKLSRPISTEKSDFLTTLKKFVEEFAVEEE